MENLKMQMSTKRRSFHKIAEPGWMEFRTTLRLLEELSSYGYELDYGKKIHSQRMGLPKEEIMKAYVDSLGLKSDFDLSEILEGYTGVVARLDTGRKGPRIGLRFDIDANGIEEARDEGHRPFSEGFASENNFAMHACGHDGHMTIGLTLAKWVSENRDNLKGSFTFIFQPAEEGVRGAKSMVGAGVVDNLDYLLGGHLGLGVESGVLGLGTVGFLATSKLDIYFEGVPSHSGASPELGRNALLAAASCALNLHSLPQFGSGMSRLNVGILRAGSSRNVVPSTAFMEVETRGENEEINQLLREKVDKVIEGSALAFGVKFRVEEAGGAPAYNSYDKDFVALVADHLEGDFKIDIARSLGGSEDITYMMNRVEELGGRSLHFMFGSDLKAAHHNNRFDFDEESLAMAFKALRRTIELLVEE